MTRLSRRIAAPSERVSSPCRRPAFSRPLSALVVFADSLRAADAPLPSPGDVKSLAIHPAKVALVGSDAAAQLVVTATLADGRLRRPHARREVRGRRRQGRARHCRPAASCRWPTARPRSSPRSATRPLACRVDDEVASARTCRSTSPTRSCRSSPSSAATAAAATARLAGQNGFRLSLLGFEPDLDFTTLVKEGRGRRLFPAAPGRAACCC